MVLWLIFHFHAYYTLIQFYGFTVLRFYSFTVLQFYGCMLLQCYSLSSISNTPYKYLLSKMTWLPVFANLIQNVQTSSDQAGSFTIYNTYWQTLANLDSRWYKQAVASVINLLHIIYDMIGIGTNHLEEVEGSKPQSIAKFCQAVLLRIHANLF